MRFIISETPKLLVMGKKGHTYPVHVLTEFYALYSSQPLQGIWHTLKSPLVHTDVVQML